MRHMLYTNRKAKGYNMKSVKTNGKLKLKPKKP